MANSRKRIIFWQLAPVVLALLITQQAHALVGGFIADISVSERDGGAEILLFFNCASRYVTHMPSSQSQELRIQLDAFESCLGASAIAILARDTKQVLLPNAIGPVDVEYVGDSPGGPQLILQFDNEVRYMLQSQHDARQLRIFVFRTTRIPDTGSNGNTSGISKAADPLSIEEGDRYLTAARQAMISGDLSRAIQLYTKLLRDQQHPAARDAQELLGLARERNGQLAHAKSEYERYLFLYPDDEGAKRVQQRLAAMLATGTEKPTKAESTTLAQKRTENWRADAYLSQYYRQQARQTSGSDLSASFSSLVSDADFRMRRRGERFDVLTRLTTSYWFDLLNEDGPGNQNRVSQAYVEVNDKLSRLRAKLGRQSRSTSGVLGRFDGLLVEYGLRDDINLSLSTGFSVYSTKQGFDDTRSFYGMSIDFEDVVVTNFDITPFFNRQATDGIDDRQSIGVETRYVDERRSMIGVVDYDFSYGALNSVYLLGNWRTQGELTISGTMDRRHSPFLSVSNALLGQSLTSLEELLLSFSEPEIRQLAQDRTAVNTSFRLGLSQPFLQRWRIDADIIQSRTSGTIASGGAVETPSTDGFYYSTSLMGQSLLKQGDAIILGLRAANTPSYESMTFTLDGRLPFGTIRINPRIRIDKRNRIADGGTDWIYSPRLRLQIRWRHSNQFELEAGGILTSRQVAGITDEINTYFFNAGYRYVF